MADPTDQAKDNYLHTPEDVLHMSECMRLGFVVTPICQQVKVRKSPVKLSYKYRGKVYHSSEPEFEQKHLGYHIAKLYDKLYNNLKKQNRI